MGHWALYTKRVHLTHLCESVDGIIHNCNNVDLCHSLMGGPLDFETLMISCIWMVMLRI